MTTARSVLLDADGRDFLVVNQDGYPCPLAVDGQAATYELTRPSTSPQEVSRV